MFVEINKCNKKLKAYLEEKDNKVNLIDILNENRIKYISFGNFIRMNEYYRIGLKKPF